MFDNLWNSNPTLVTDQKDGWSVSMDDRLIQLTVSSGGHIIKMNMGSAIAQDLIDELQALIPLAKKREGGLNV